MLYTDGISINSNFRTAVNLDLDLNDEKKIAQYIVTSDICDVIKEYMKACLGMNQDKATVLVGPYGKGKSFLILVLTYLLGGKKNSKTYRNIVDAIRTTDDDLAGLIDTFNSKKMKFLPVIVNLNYDNLEQAFLIALNEALKREKIDNIVPNSSFEVCRSLIDKWEADPSFKEETIRYCEKENHISLSDLKQKLSTYSEEAYQKFESMYNCITHGMPFNPLVSNDITKIYREVNSKICERTYSGMFIIFDEFSKYLESAGGNISLDLAIIQKLAEAAKNSSPAEQLHICCITHKGLTLYGNTSEKVNAFKTVEGRFKEISFSRSLGENYQITASAINNSKLEGNIDVFVKQHAEYYEQVRQTLSDMNDNDWHNLIYGCYPMNPVAVTMLIKLSEKVAQNERTLFTFISENDDQGLRGFLNSNDVNSCLMPVSYLYDYFERAIRNEDDNDLKSIRYRTEATLSQISDPIKRGIIKALAVILIIRSDEFPADDRNLYLCTMIPQEKVSALVNQMINDHLLKRNVINEQLSFATANSKEIDEKIAIAIQKIGNSFAEERVLGEVDKKKFILPRHHNTAKKITRYFRNAYVTEEQFKVLSSTQNLKNEEFSDGLIVSIIRKKMSEEEIIHRAEEYQEKNVVFRYPSESIPDYLETLLKRYSALQNISSKGEDEIVKAELRLLKDETEDSIESIIQEYFYKNAHSYAKGFSADKPLTELLSDVMDQYYSKALVISNELINKNTVSAQYKNPTIHVIDCLLSGERPIPYSLTSAENTIYSTVIEMAHRNDEEKEDILAVVQEIKERIAGSLGQRKSVDSIIRDFIEAPYGVRLGVMMVLFGKAISELPQNVILYLKDHEIDLNASNITKCIENAEQYYISVSQSSIEQENYVRDMLALLKAKLDDRFRMNVKLLAEALRRFYVGLPRIMREIADPAAVGIDPKVREYLSYFGRFNINPFETVCEKLELVFRNQSYDEILLLMQDLIENWESKLDNYKNHIAERIKSELHFSASASLKTEMMNLVDKDSVFIGSDDNTGKRIHKAILAMSYDDAEAVDRIAYAVFNNSVADWNKDYTNDLIDALKEFVGQMDSQNDIKISADSLFGVLMNWEGEIETPYAAAAENAVRGAMDDFGDSLSAKDKLAILAKIIKELMF